ncbi:MAG: HAMP domain-containing protein, partial [Candidatus Latescibacteria bacterium]|nr:HAMP domain-containing protein [Candidatus Latescibacterota bacterium]
MKINIGPKLIGGFLIVAALVAFAAFMGISKVGSVSDQTDIIAQNRSPQLHAAMQLQVLQKAARVNLLELSLVRTRMDQWTHYKENYQQRADEFDAWAQGILNGNEQFHLQACRKGGRIEALAKEAQVGFAGFVAVAEELIAHKRQLLELVNAGRMDAAEAMTDAELMVLVREKLQTASKAVEEPIEAGAERAEEQMAEAVESAHATQSSANTTLLVTLFVAVGLAAGIGVLIARSITGPVTQLRDASLQMAQGNTDVQLTITSQDELGELVRAFEEMGENIRGIVAEMGTLSESTVEGKLDVRGDAAKFGGDFAGIVQGVNNTLDAVIGPLNMMAEYVDRI